MSGYPKTGKGSAVARAMAGAGVGKSAAPDAAKPTKPGAPSLAASQAATAKRAELAKAALRKAKLTDAPAKQPAAKITNKAAVAATKAAVKASRPAEATPTPARPQKSLAQSAPRPAMQATRPQSTQPAAKQQAQPQRATKPAATPVFERPDVPPFIPQATPSKKAVAKPAAKAAPAKPAPVQTKPAAPKPAPVQAPVPVAAAKPAAKEQGPKPTLKAVGATPVIKTASPVNSTEAPRAAQRFSKRLTARADLLRVYAGLLGSDVVARDLLEGMSGSSHPEDSAETLQAGLEAAGLNTEIRAVRALNQKAWPALAEMKSGQIVLVLSQSRSAVTIYEAGAPDNRSDVPINDFLAYFAGRLVCAEASLDDIARAHTPPEARKHWFWAEFPRFKRYFGEVAMGSFVANLLAVAVALFSLQVYDRVIPHQSQATLWVLAAGAGLALCLEAGLKIARSRLMDNVGRQIDLSLQQMLMERILGMRSDVAGRAPSQVFGTMREFSSIREFFTAATIGTLADIPFIFIFLLLVASIAGPVVWVLIAGGILMVLPSFFMQRRMIRLTEEMQGASIKSGRLLQEAIYELDTVKTQRAEDRIRRVWSELTALSALKSSDQRKLASTLSFWSQGVQQATYVCAVIAGTFLVFAGEFTVGSIIAVGILTSRTLAPLTQLAGVMARWGNVKSALTALDQIVEAPQDADENRTYLRREKIDGSFELREVRFAYQDEGATVVDVPGVNITAGQKVAILGTNGSGKSTFLKMLSGLYAPSSGRILLDGTDIGQIEPRDVRRLVGYLGQDVRLFAGTLRDNLNLNMLERDDGRLLQALDFAGLGPFVKNHPKGLDLEITDGGQGLSVGQRQSIGWARLWLQDPKVCLLDEPTAALDQTLEKTLISRLEGWLKGRTAIIATHRMPIVELTSRTLVLQNGRMAVDGPREEVLRHLAGVKTGRAS